MASLGQGRGAGTVAMSAPPFRSVESIEKELEIDLAPDARTRVREALIDLAIARGIEGFGVPDLCCEAEIDPEVFGHSFDDLEAAFSWVHRTYTAELKMAIAAGFESQSNWADAMRCAAYAAARWFEENPNALRFGMIDSRGAGEQAEIAREETLNWAVDLIDTGRGELGDPQSKDRSTAIAAMGASYNSLSNGVMKEGRNLRPSEYVADWLYIAVMPYLGREAALAELDRREGDLELFRNGEI